MERLERIELMNELSIYPKENKSVSRLGGAERYPPLRRPMVSRHSTCLRRRLTPAEKQRKKQYTTEKKQANHGKCKIAP